ncbi:hypothetical protein HQ545_07320 [Candidatus Woesearchaeota archaeon]|nr:hypothetical protein [Candidatus Woesearchaeota archaeon]
MPVKSQVSNKSKLSKAKVSKAKVSKVKSNPSKSKSSNYVNPARPVSRSALDKELERIERDIDNLKSHVVSPPPDIKPLDYEPRTISSENLVPEFVKEEKKVVREFSLGDSGILGAYFVSSLLCVTVLAFLFGSVGSFIFFTAFGLFIWWLSHQSHQSKSGMLRSFILLGSMVLIVYFAYWYFNDLLSLLVCIIYSVSFVIAGLLYIYHQNRGLEKEIHSSFSRTFLVVLYAHVMSLAAASLLAYIISYLVVGDSFVSIMYLVVSWALLPLVLYFFLNKFFYLRFFDPVHIMKDVKKSVIQGILYSSVFICMIILAYLLTSIQLLFSETDGYSDAFTSIFTNVQEVNSEIDSAAVSIGDSDLAGLEVSNDIRGLADDLFTEAADLKLSLRDLSFSLGDYISDGYFTSLARNRFVLARVGLMSDEVVEVKDDLFREAQRLRMMQESNSFDDGTFSLEGHLTLLEQSVDSSYLSYSETAEFTRIRGKFANNDSFSGLLSDGELFEFGLVYHPSMYLFESGDSRFSRRFMEVLYHTVIFRDLMLFVFDNVALQVSEGIEPTAIQSIYPGALDEDESIRSKVVRHRIIRSNVDAVLALGNY